MCIPVDLHLLPLGFLISESELLIVLFCRSPHQASKEKKIVTGTPQNFTYQHTLLKSKYFGWKLCESLTLLTKGKSQSLAFSTNTQEEIIIHCYSMELSFKHYSHWNLWRGLAASFIDKCTFIGFHRKAIVHALWSSGVVIHRVYWHWSTHPVNFKNVMISFPCCLYKKRDKFGIDEETAIYFNPLGTRRETSVMTGYCRDVGWKNYRFFWRIAGKRPSYEALLASLVIKINN